MKKALVVVSFGTTYEGAINAIVNIEETCRKAYPDYDFYRAFTSGMIIRKLKKTKDITIMSHEEAMEHLVAEGYEEVICQPTHIIGGIEYDKLSAILLKYKDKIPVIRVGKPLLSDESDYEIVCQAVMGQVKDRLGENGKVISRDLTEYKTDFIKENNERMHYNQVTVEEWDACTPDPELFGKADLVIADLPCSGLGIMGRKNDIKYHTDSLALEDLVKIQRRILTQAWRYVRPGGEMIYSTCTLFDGENIENVRWIEKNTPLHLVSMEDQLPEELKGRTGKEGYLQLIPGQDKCDGFFFAKFKNKG